MKERKREKNNSSNTDCDQDSEVSLMGNIDTTEIEEDWIGYMKKKHETQPVSLAGL